MRTRNELYQAAMRTVSARRQKARARAEDARAEARAAIPALKAAEDQVTACGVRCALAGARGADRTAAASALAAARQKRDALLAASGRSPLALEPKYTCSLCQDTGVADGKTCVCVRREMQRLRREEIEAMSSLSVTSFDTMKLDYYPNTPDPKTGRSVRQYMAELLADLRDYAEEFDLDSENLMLTGNAGLGKTHAALAVAGAALDKGYDVIYISSPDFFSRVETLHFGSDPAGEKDALLDTVGGADLLILDDLGTEFNSSFVISTLYSLLNDRLGRRRPTILTSNIVDGTLLEKLYTEKVASRISAFVPYRFLGDDIRLKKALEP
ncbi:ATP-binding protein [Faecalibacterium sp. An122]|uniref:ATP-binding protein n=1 Tax=Faecalibacterium sp. An122 TaxID=1965551 RepID=UPI000B38057B|nr:ATP-binding protein [Faecalibacterium sp. An122]OUQ33200.1 DNA replication protein [Faecalibacterium sp. An122]